MKASPHQGYFGLGPLGPFSVEGEGCFRLRDAIMSDLLGLRAEL